MAAKNEQRNKPKKRKQIPVTKTGSHGFASKKPKLVDSKSSNPPNKGSVKPFVPSKRKEHQPLRSRFKKSEHGNEKNLPLTKQERRLHAKGLAEARKKKRKRHYTLEQELANLWEKMRCRNIAKEDRSKLVSEALQKMKGKIHEIASSHVSSRVLQTCVKYCSPAERDAVYEELKPHFLTLSCNTYAVHLVKKMLENASKNQLAGFISSLHGHVASLLRHMVGSVVVEHAYSLGNSSQKQELLLELYSIELQLFKDLVSMKESRLIDVISKLGIQKGSVLRHMTSVIQPILEKGIVDHSIIHRVLIEYLNIADQSSATDVIQQLSGPLLVRMIHTRDGSRIGILCIKHGSTKERKKIIKGMKGHINKIAHDQYGSMVLACILSVVDDTKLIKKIVISDLEKNLKELVLEKNGRRLLLQLLHPNCLRYLSPDDLASLNASIPSLCKSEPVVCPEVKTDAEEAESEIETTGGEAEKSFELVEGGKKDPSVVEGGKKDPSVRRQELLIYSGLAENLVQMCTESAGDFLRSNFGREVIYEVATGGADGILHPKLDGKLHELHGAIASLVAEIKPEESENERILENFHSSRTIRKLIMDCPSFASTLWHKALEGRCKMWAQGHSCKVIHAYLESSDSTVRGLAKQELQSLIDAGVLLVPDTKQTANES